MAKLSKAQQREHNLCLDYIHSDRTLTYDEKVFVYEHYNEGATENVRQLSAFHTPMALAWDFTIDCGYGQDMLDLCAGTGILSFCGLHRSDRRETIKNIVCVEISPTYVEIGKRLLPEATWVCEDALTCDVLQYTNKRRYDHGYSNPPFGSSTKGKHKGKYTGGMFDLMVVEKIAQTCKYGAFLLPPGSVPFRLSGQHYYRREDENKNYNKFHDQTGLVLGAGVGIDTQLFKDDWKNTKILCESAVLEQRELDYMSAKRVKLYKGGPERLQEIEDYVSTIVSVAEFVKDEHIPAVRNVCEKVWLVGQKDVEKIVESMKPYTVCDPFMHTMDVAEACIKHGVPFVGISPHIGEFKAKIRSLLDEYPRK